MKGAVTWILCLFAFLMLWGSPALAQEMTQSLDVTGGEIQILSTSQAKQGNTYYDFDPAQGLVLTGSTDTNYVQVNDNIGTAEKPLRLTLQNLNIDLSGEAAVRKRPFSLMQRSFVTLTLAEGSQNTLVSGVDENGGYAALQVQSYGAGVKPSLTIDGSGSLTATGAQGSAGIGSSENRGHWVGDGGAITINSGQITARGGAGGAGIGGASGGNGGVINITGGTILATGGENAAGIGGGYHGQAGELAVNGGEVTAISGGGGAEEIGHGAEPIELVDEGVNYGSSSLTTEETPQLDDTAEVSPTHSPWPAIGLVAGVTVFFTVIFLIRRRSKKNR